MKIPARVPTDGGRQLNADNPFAALSAAGLPAALPPCAHTAKNAPPASAPCATPAPKGRGRLELRREKNGRGGKTVTTLRGEGFSRLSDSALAEYCKRFKAQSGCGGASKDGALVFQGDCRDRAELFFRAEGFRVVRAGG